MNRTIIFISLLFSFFIRLHAVDDSIYRDEAKRFLSSMPENLQNIQTEAVRRAIAGDCKALDAVRNSRNVPPELPDGVSRIDINDTLALFRDSRYKDVVTPLLVYFHGGGWTFGSINSCSRYCAAVASSGVTVLAVNYRLAPEHGFPAGLDDCIYAAKVAIDSLGKWNCSSVALGGDSSGGNLAIATAMSFPADTFSSLVLFYPVTKAFADNSPSWEKYGSGYGLDSGLMLAFNEAYTTDVHNPLVSPACAADHRLSMLPPVLMISADHDILKCQGNEFVMRLKELAVEVEYRVVPSTVHLFITVPGQPSAFRESVERSSRFILSH